jgi:hypothetical protein
MESLNMLGAITAASIVLLLGLLALRWFAGW